MEASIFLDNWANGYEIVGRKNGEYMWECAKCGGRGYTLSAQSDNGEKCECQIKN